MAGSREGDGAGQRVLFGKDGDERGTPSGAEPDAPLAARLRPRSLAEFVGQGAAVGPDSLLMRSIAAGELPSLILWGPPGCGKTTLARLLAEAWRGRFVAMSAVTAGVADVRRVVQEAGQARRLGGRTVLFLDEMHRFSKAQQDTILPHVENGTVRLIGATTENPSFEVNGALLSRCQVVRLGALGPDEMRTILRRAATDAERGLGALRVCLSEEGEDALVAAAAGDARSALGALEVAAHATAAGADGRRAIDAASVEGALLRRLPRHDRAGDAHYDTISAFIKSLRGSDADASVYWLARLLEAGEDPLFVARRMVLLAAEDVGLADPQALAMAVAALSAVHAIGMPEAYLPLAETALYLALAEKSNSAYLAYGAAREAVLAVPDLPVPLHLRNAPTALMREAGYGQGYRYAHDFPGGVAGQRYLPEGLLRGAFYRPGSRGAEAALARRWQEVSGQIDARGGAEAPPARGDRAGEASRDRPESREGS